MQNGGEGHVASALAIAGTVAYGGAVVSGGVQLGRNAEARRELVVAFTPTANGFAMHVAFQSSGRSRRDVRVLLNPFGEWPWLAAVEIK